MARSQLLTDFIGLLISQKRGAMPAANAESGLEEHLTPYRLAQFYALWTYDPDAVSEDEFFEIHSHLLKCVRCEQIGRACEGHALAQSNSKSIN